MAAKIKRVPGPYYIVKHASLDKLIGEVSRFIKAGWKPQGGIAAVSNGRKISFLQALTLNG